MQKDKNVVGYFYNDIFENTHHYPKAQDCVDQEWKDDSIEFALLLEELQRQIKSGEIKGRIIQYKGISICRICRCMNGSTEYVCENFIWPDGYIHYIRKHHVKPPKEFIDFVHNKIPE